MVIKVLMLVRSRRACLLSCLLDMLLQDSSSFSKSIQERAVELPFSWWTEQTSLQTQVEASVQSVERKQTIRAVPALG